jgi:UTP:GlnB (protein PII) uridylyltransferase
LNVLGADITTWGDGAVLDIFTVQSPSLPNRADVTNTVTKALSGRRVKVSNTQFSLDAVVDNSAHPWHSVLTVTGPDRTGLLRDVTATLANLKVDIHHATISTEHGTAKNSFEVADRLGRKLTSDAISRVISALQ